MTRALALALLVGLTLPPTALAQSMIPKGSTDVTRYIVLVSSSTGAPATGLTITGLDLQYTRNRATPATKVDATALSATNDAHADNQCIEVDGTSSPGLYRCDWPDAAFASGADKVILVVSESTVFPAIEEIQLVDFDPEDSVRLGLTALPNAAADAAGGLPISDAGGLDLDGRLDAAVSSRLAPTTAGRTLDVTTTGEAGVDLSNVNGTLDAAEIGTDAITATKIAAAAITSSEAPNLDAAVTSRLAPTVAGRTLDVTTTGEAGVDFSNINGTLDAAEIGSNAITAAKIGADAITAAKIAAGAMVKGSEITGFNDLSAAQVNAEVDTAIADARLDELLAADSDIDGAAPPTVGSVFHELMSATAGSFTFDQTTDSNEALRNNVGTAGAGLSAVPTVDANVVEILGTAVSETNAGDVAESFSFFYDVDPVTTKTVDDVGVAGSGLTQQDVRDAMKLAPTAGAPAGGSVDEALDNIEGDTNELQGNQNWDVWDDGTRTLTALDEDSTTLDLDATAVGSVSGSVGSLGVQAKLDVNAEVDSALNTAIPGTPTADSINERIAAIDDKLPAGSIGDATAANQASIESDTQDIQASIGTVTDLGGGATLAFNLADIESQTDDIGAAGAGLTAIPSAAIPKNQALANFPFLMVSSTDHISPATGLTVAGQLSCDAGAFSGVTGTIAEVGNGVYQFDADAADTNCDSLTWRFNATGADTVYIFLRTEQ